MKLSEAIRLGAMLRPQTFFKFFDDDGTSCAMGGAAEATGWAFHPHEIDGIYGHLERKFPIAYGDTSFTCPVCHERYGTGSLHNVVAHLNNNHRWSRERIADWVEQVEREREAAKQLENATPVECAR